MGEARLGEKFCLALLTTVWEIHTANPDGGVIDHLAGVIDESPDFVRVEGSRSSRWRLTGSTKVLVINENGFHVGQLREDRREPWRGREKHFRFPG